MDLPSSLSRHAGSATRASRSSSSLASGVSLQASRALRVSDSSPALWLPGASRISSSLASSVSLRGGQPRLKFMLCREPNCRLRLYGEPNACLCLLCLPAFCLAGRLPPHMHPRPSPCCLLFKPQIRLGMQYCGCYVLLLTGFRGPVTNVQHNNVIGFVILFVIVIGLRPAWHVALPTHLLHSPAQDSPRSASLPGPWKLMSLYVITAAPR